MPQFKPVRYSAKNRASSLAAGRRRRGHLEPIATADPATADRIYSDEEREVLAAIADYQARTGRRFPSHCEVLEVLKSLGYRRP